MLIFTLLRAVFTCLAVSMRFEPANAKYFQVEMNCGNSMVETIKLLGCFSNETKMQHATKKPKEEYEKLFQDIFSANIADTKKHEDKLPKTMLSSAILIRMLYDMAVDNYDKTRPMSGSSTAQLKPPLSKADAVDDDNDEEEVPAPVSPSVRRITSLNLTPVAPDPVIVHSGIVTTILKVMPSLYFESNHELSTALQIHTAEVIKSLLRTEKNQQIMCDVGFVSDILHFCKGILEDELHILHSPFQYLLERLAAQKLEPKDLRLFLRLGNPLSCLNDDERQANQKTGGFIPLTRIKTLVSMTTPRDLHVQNNSILPPFIEFDMSAEGFGCLFLPSMAPSSPHSSSVVGVGSMVSQEGLVIGGIGQGDRAFPPQPGMTFATWVCIDKFCDPRVDPHPVRLLTLMRQVKGAEETEPYVCLQLSLSARDKAVIVSTQESTLQKLE